MFDLATNSEIGIYLEHLIKKKYQETGDTKYTIIKNQKKKCTMREYIFSKLISIITRTDINSSSLKNQFISQILLEKREMNFILFA